MSRTIYTLRSRLTGESQTVIVCDTHALEMPAVGENVDAAPADDECPCEFCQRTVAQVAVAPATHADLQALAQSMLDACAIYWQAFSAVHGANDTVWVVGSIGDMAVYTRGEYADRIRAALPTDNTGTIPFDGGAK